LLQDELEKLRGMQKSNQKLKEKYQKLKEEKGQLESELNAEREAN